MGKFTDLARKVLDGASCHTKTVIEPRWEVGCHYSAVNILAPMVVPGCRTAVLVIEPMERLNYFEQYKKLEEQGESVPSLGGDAISFIVPGAPILYVMTPKEVIKFYGINPDLVICSCVRANGRDLVKGHVKTYGICAILWRR